MSRCKIADLLTFGTSGKGEGTLAVLARESIIEVEGARSEMHKI